MESRRLETFFLSFVALTAPLRVDYHRCVPKLHPGTLEPGVSLAIIVFSQFFFYYFLKRLRDNIADLSGHGPF